MSLTLSLEFDPILHSQARNDRDTKMWLRTRKETSAGEQQLWWDNLYNDPSKQYWTIKNDKDKLVGMVGFTDLNDHDAEFSCLIYPSHRNKGYGLEALRLLFNLGFKEMGLQRIYGWTYGYKNHLMNGIPIDIAHVGLVMVNPAYKLFDKIGMEIYGPCLYPDTNEPYEPTKLVWRLDLMRYKWEKAC